jgi:hypothetical protein
MKDNKIERLKEMMKATKIGNTLAGDTLKLLNSDENKDELIVIGAYLMALVRAYGQSSIYRSISEMMELSAVGIKQEENGTYDYIDIYEILFIGNKLKEAFLISELLNTKIKKEELHIIARTFTM